MQETMIKEPAPLIREEELPRVSDYCAGRTPARRVDIGDITLWFSYETLVAFRACNCGIVICENTWGPTTGKHLNNIPSGIRNRVCRTEFLNLYKTYIGDRLS